MTPKKIHPSIFCGLTIAALLAHVGCSSVGPETDESKERFNRVDKNRDGRLTIDEIQFSLVEVLFTSRDANKDGKLTKKEWIVPSEPVGAATFRAHDLNGDGVVTFAEALEAAKKQGGMAAEFLKAADTNRDGAVDLREARAYYARTEGPIR
jgi:hypothetical protein